MTISIDENTIGMWCVDLGPMGNWLAHVGYKDASHTKILIDCRFRWYEDDKIHDSKDRKSWYHIETQATLERQTIDKIRRVFEGLREKAPSHRGWELLKGARSIEEFSEELKRMPGMSWLLQQHQ